ncbi:MAG: WYL domain-containing protein [bacterium]|nr:WYL domain-containing protein [bacterium]MDY4099712.1 WYL domain-containing protein [Lachnospiraceae bacterium]
MATKPDSSRLNTFYILYVLANYSDEEHPLSVSDIGKRVDEEFGYLTATGPLISSDTVKRTLEELTEKIFVSGIDDEMISHRFGYFIYCVMKQGERFVPYHAAEGKQAPKKYYYYESSLKTGEIITLKDAVETYSFFSEEDITDIVRKIIKLRPLSFSRRRYYDAAGEDRDENSLLLMNIEELNEIIHNRNCAQIMYCYYDTDKKLIPRDGYPKTIEPIHLMWSNGYYYLLAYNEKYQTIVSFRVDRITDIEEVEIENTHRVEQFNPVQYRHEHPIMFGGKKERIVLLCRDTGKNYIMNMIVDVFGKKVKVSEASEELVKEVTGHSVGEEREQGKRWLKVVLEAAVGGVELWATQYCNDCVVVSPEELRISVKERLERGLRFYKE